MPAIGFVQQESFGGEVSHSPYLINGKIDAVVP